MNDLKQQGITASNQAFSRFEQVKKEQKYQLSEQAGLDRYDDDYIIQSCDLKSYFEGGSEGKARFGKCMQHVLEGDVWSSSTHLLRYRSLIVVVRGNYGARSLPLTC